MKAKQHKNLNAVCPYYHKHDGIKIYCGFTSVPNSASVQLTFYDGEEKRRYMKAKCESDYGSCPIAQTNERTTDDR